MSSITDSKSESQQNLYKQTPNISVKSILASDSTYSNNQGVIYISQWVRVKHLNCTAELELLHT